MNTGWSEATIAHVFAHQALHLAGILLSPVMPTKSTELLDMLGIAESERTWEYAERVFGAPGGVSEGLVIVEYRGGGQSTERTVLFPKLESAGVKK